jgi:cytochrome P450
MKILIFFPFRYLDHYATFVGALALSMLYTIIGPVYSNSRTLGDISPYIPQDSASEAFITKGNKMLEDRQRIGKSRQDVLTHLLGEDNETGLTFTQPELLANSQLLIIAGTGELTYHSAL